MDDIDSNVSLSPLTFVCTKPDGELLTTQTLKWCNKVVQKNLPEISHFHFHCLRHTYASTLVLNGAKNPERKLSIYLRMLFLIR